MAGDRKPRGAARIAYGVEEIDHGHRLLLRAEMRLPRTAWLECSVGTGPDGGTEYRQSVTFVPAGLAGHLYWWVQRPLHDLVFGVMAHGIVRSAERRSVPALQTAGAY